MDLFGLNFNPFKGMFDKGASESNGSPIMGNLLASKGIGNAGTAGGGMLSGLDSKGGALDTDLLMKYLSGAGISMMQGRPAYEGLNKVTSLNQSGKDNKNSQTSMIELLTKILSGEDVENKLGGG